MKTSIISREIDRHDIVPFLLTVFNHREWRNISIEQTELGKTWIFNSTIKEGKFNFIGCYEDPTKEFVEYMADESEDVLKINKIHVEFIPDANPRICFSTTFNDKEGPRPEAPKTRIDYKGNRFKILERANWALNKFSITAKTEVRDYVDFEHN